MPLLFPDKRKAISGQFFINDSIIRLNSRRAHKRIRSWKDSFHASDEAELHYRQQFDNLMFHSFFNTVSYLFVLSKEKFYEKSLLN